MSGLVVAATVGGAALPASADTLPTNDVSEQDLGTYKANSNLKVGEHIELGPGEKYRRTGALLLFVLNEPDGKPQGMHLEWASWDGISAMPVYPLILDGEETDYLLKTRIYTEPGDNRAHGECEILKSWARYSTESSPFQCETHKHGFDNDFDFTVSLKSLAEASGTITPENVDLSDGTFRTDVDYHHPGATELTSGESTRFDAYLRKWDTPFYVNQARTEWAYQIIDHGVATGRWAAGLSTNFNGAMGHSADKRCAVYDSNPLEGKGRLDGQHPIEDPTYTCTAAGETLDGIGGAYNPRFDATFTVGRK